MSKKDLDKLKDYFDRVYPTIWEYYKFFFDLKTKTSFEAILALESLLALMFIELFRDLILEGHVLFLIPLFVYFISILVSSASLIPKFIWFPWSEKEDLKKSFEKIEETSFSEEGLKSIYGTLGHLGAFSNRRNKIYSINVFFLYLAVTLSIISILVYHKLNLLLYSFIPLAVALWIFIRKGWGKELVKENPSKEAEKFFDDWKKEILRR